MSGPYRLIDDIGGQRRISAAEYARREDAMRSGAFDRGRDDYITNSDYAADPDGDTAWDEGYAAGWASAEREECDW